MCLCGNLLFSDKSRGCAAALQHPQLMSDVFRAKKKNLWNKSGRAGRRSEFKLNTRLLSVGRGGGSLLPNCNLDVSRSCSLPKLGRLTQLYKYKRWDVASQPSLWRRGDMPVLLYSGQEGKSLYSSLLFLSATSQTVLHYYSQISSCFIRAAVHTDQQFRAPRWIRCLVLESDQGRPFLRMCLQVTLQ